jgi:hypothetical protein
VSTDYRREGIELTCCFRDLVHRLFLLRIGMCQMPLQFARRRTWKRFKCNAKPLTYFLTDLEAGAKYFNKKPVHKTAAAKMTKRVEKANLLKADVVALETSPSFLPAVRSHRVRWLIAFHMLRLKKAGIDATSVPIVLQVDQRADRVPCVGAGPPVVPCVTTEGVYFVTSLNKCFRNCCRFRGCHCKTK